MTQIEDNGVEIGIQLRSMELMNVSFNFIDAIQIQNTDEMSFNISIDTKAEEATKIVVATVKIEVLHKETQHKFGKIEMLFIFEVENYNELIKLSEDKKQVEIHPSLVQMINAITLSTTRGVMFSEFRGTRLHGAVLPVINVKKMQGIPLPPIEK